MVEILILIFFFVLFYSYKNNKVHYVTATLWLFYPVYEIWVQTTCSGECNIRVDLLIIYPILLAFLIASLAKIVINKYKVKSEPKHEPVKEKHV